jgi:hypothetical protein
VGGRPLFVWMRSGMLRVRQDPYSRWSCCSQSLTGYSWLYDVWWPGPLTCLACTAQFVATGAAAAVGSAPSVVIHCFCYAAVVGMESHQHSC